MIDFLPNSPTLRCLLFYTWLPHVLRRLRHLTTRESPLRSVDKQTSGIQAAGFPVGHNINLMIPSQDLTR
ncbi:unnamed protein product [Litomosoides sigmodontis]|uniref:Uncharacterized protein n=1 Tax=Litomosoides sigmodontis TaxID=42156 RepID=A0A3P6SIH8_LITSI|nr:unnamed protein product [Litomosoides sigmodontis]